MKDLVVSQSEEYRSMKLREVPFEGAIVLSLEVANHGGSAAYFGSPQEIVTFLEYALAEAKNYLT